MSEKVDYAEPGADHKKMQPYWDKVDLLIAGQDEVIASGETLLPKFPAEDAASYKFRKSLGKYTNVFRDISETLASKPFEEEIQLAGATIDPTIKEFVENVDGDGNNISVFAAELFFNGIVSAIDWLFVDYPDAIGIRTVADAKAANLRPYWSRVLGRNMLEAKVQFIGGANVLTYARFLESAEMGSRRVKIFERTQAGKIVWKVYSEHEKEWILTGEGALSIPVIPLVPFYTGRRNGKSFVFYPALQDAASLQVILYRQESALEYAKTMTAFPMLSGSGVTPEKNPDGSVKQMQIGPQCVLFAPINGDGKSGSWSYVEPSGESLKILSSEVDKTKQDLRELGKQPLTAQSGNLTVITTAYAAGKSKSAVRAWGNSLKDALENALKITAQYLNLRDVEPEVSIYDEYDDFSEDDMQHVTEARKNGDLSQETYWAEMKRRAVLSAEFDPKKERLALLKEVPSDTNPDDEQDPEPAPGNAPKQNAE